MADTETFECGICTEDHPLPPASIFEDAELCKACIDKEIIPRFRNALESEYNLKGCKWGDTPLRPEIFREHFPDWNEFSRAWEAKMVEYNMITNERLYCRHCESFLGKKPDGSDYVFCNKCNTNVCSKCGLKDHKARDCQPGTSGDDVTDDPACQRCPNPNCRRAYWLHDGCNHMKCESCNQEWCWICGEASPSEDHWQTGKPCPRYHAADDPNATFDRNDEEEAAFLARVILEIKFSPASIPDEILDFEPPEPHPSIIADLKHLAWQQTWINIFTEDGGWEIGPQATALVLALQGKHEPTAAELKSFIWGSNGTAYGLNMVQADRAQILACMPEAETADPPPPPDGVEESVMEECYDFVVLLHFLYSLLSEPTRFAGRNLPMAVEGHMRLINAYRRVSLCEPLKRKYGPIFILAVKYFIAAPPRVAALMHVRAQQRQQAGLLESLEGEDGEEVREMVEILLEREENGELEILD